MYGWALTQLNEVLVRGGSLDTRRDTRHAHQQREDHARSPGEDDHLQGRTEAPEKKAKLNNNNNNI